MSDFKWSADLVAAHLTSLPSIAGKLLVVPCCSWYGHEADLLVIENKMRIVDIEIKISRSDLKADAKKEKWWRTRPWSRRARTGEPLEWPAKVWKHYYALPKEIWTPDLLACISPASGVILLSPKQSWQSRPGTMPSNHYAHVLRPAKPNKDAKPITARDAIDVARLSSLRYWSLVKQAGISAYQPPTGDPNA